MSRPTDRDGTFRAEIIGYRLAEFDSGAVAVEIKAKLLEWWSEQNKEWSPWEEYQFEAEGPIFIVKKDGRPNEIGVKSLVNAGWDCSILSLRDNQWQPARCQVVVKSEVFKDQARFRIDSMSDWNRQPGGSSMSADKANALASRLDSQFRAIAGTVRTNAAPPSPGRPTLPPPRPANGNGNGHSLRAADTPVDPTPLPPPPPGRDDPEVPF